VLENRTQTAGASDTIGGMATWPATVHELTQLQHALAELTPEPWQPPATVLRIGACFVCFERVHGAGAAGDRGFAGAAVTSRRRLLAGVSVSGLAGGPYRPALLALREGPLLEQAVRALPITPEVLVVNATGRDHPRRAGLALHLGAVLGLPTVGVTTRPLVARAPGLSTNALPRPRCCWMARWSAPGSGPGRGPGRWWSMPPGRPTPRTRSRWPWPRPDVLGPQSPCAAPAP
jgi:deoxyinosine 3'endonuclease (endonuclease V)